MNLPWVSFLWAVPVFGLIILVHELGHFAAAKLFGIRVHEFAIGFGPALAGFTAGETRYNLRLFMIFGGFVRMAGMEDGDTEDPRGYAAKPVWQRAIVIAAGPLMNFVLAALLFGLLFKMMGEPRLAEVREVIPDTPAAAAGLQPGDRIVAMDGQPIQLWSELVTRLHGREGQVVHLVIERDGARLERDVQYLFNEKLGQYALGIRPRAHPTPLGTALVKGVRTTMLYSGAWFREVGRLMARNGALQQLVGPVGIVGTIAEVSRQGLIELINLAGVLSINIGIVNLIPIPALDGSRLMFLGIELVRGRRIDPLRENLIHFVGLVFLLGLVLLITLVNDIPALQ